MKIALISTDSNTWCFGIRLISAALKRAGHHTRLILLPCESPELPTEVLDQVRQLAADAELIGLSCYSRGSAQASQVAKMLRPTGKPIVWGGLHATLNPAECVQVAGIVCRGEGETAIIDLAAAIAERRDWRNVANLAFTNDAGELVLNPIAPAVTDLDSLPLYDFDRDHEYLLEGVTVRRLSPNPREANPGQVQFIGSRGCAFHCTYCCNLRLKELYGGNRQYLRRMTVPHYIDQLEIMVERHFPKATDFFFLDEDFFLRPAAELEEFGRQYRDRIGLPFDCMVSPPRVTEEKVKALADAGLWRISLGVESGSERTKREVYDRKITNQMVIQASRVLNKFPSVTPCYFFIIGNPYEGPRDLLDTLHLMTELAWPYQSNMYNLVFFPGSALYDRAVADGVIHGAADSGYQLHFRAGLRVDEHAWKQRNLYLNMLLFFAEGTASRRWIGAVPRAWIPFLTRPHVVEFFEKQRLLCRLLIQLRVRALSARATLGRWLRKIVSNPAELHHPGLLVRNMLRRLAPQR